ncbi:hypothetical protein WJX74_001903 [Apatococcus lobatus]|uniref:Uncharacterized protein n=1 Tax=Apatococcus lobatus TaxID=904363 RepID=A0AAW1S925_9CHLO
MLKARHEPETEGVMPRRSSPQALTRSSSDDTLSDIFSTLSLESHKNSRLEKLEDQLSALKLQKDLSNAKFKAFVKSQHICLGNCKSYHSHADLLRALSKPENRVNRNDAKKFPAVKQCLVKLC